MNRQKPHTKQTLSTHKWKDRKSDEDDKNNEMERIGRMKDIIHLNDIHSTSLQIWSTMFYGRDT